MTENAASAVGEVGGMIAGLEARLAENPDDAEGWRMLGWSYFNTEKYDLASKAYEKSVELDASDPAVLAAYGETLVRAQKGLISEKAQSVFDDVLALNPSEPRARFFKGMALEQSGNSKGAIELWLAILDDAPSNADWVGGLEQRVQELAAATGYDLGDRFNGAGVLNQSTASLLPPKTERGPTQKDINAAQTMTAEDRQAMIVGMVDQLAARLEDDPSNVDDWVKLMRSRLVLKDTSAALSAYNRASEIFSDQPLKLSKVTTAAQQLGLSTD
jgi:cytochrome c-type biogenesis protein CcmH